MGRIMAIYRGFLGDAGPLSYYNVIRAMAVLGVIGSVIWTWALTPLWPW